MASRKTGQSLDITLDGHEVRAFVPAPLPPANPDLTLDGALEIQAELARQEMDKLDLIARLAAGSPWLRRIFALLEAVASSRLAGSQATLQGLLSHEARDELERRQAADADVQEAANLVAALAYAREQLANPQGLPLSLHLLREVHARLLRRGRGSAGRPGEFRTIAMPYRRGRAGRVHGVPPPPAEMHLCLADLESYLHSDDGLPPLVRTAMLHAQLLNLHPFLGGNGRTARLLSQLLVERWAGLSEPMLFISQFFLEHREEYRSRLTAIRREGDWEGWTWFFLEGAITTAREAARTAASLLALLEQDRRRALAAPRDALAATRLLEHLPEHPVISVTEAARLLHTTKPTAGKAVERLESLTILHETTGRRRGRRYEYRALLERLPPDEEEA